MLSREFIRSNPETVKQAIRQRCDDVSIDRLLELDAEQRQLKKSGEDLKSERNQLSKSFSDAGLTIDSRDELRQRATDLRARIGEIDSRINDLETELHDLELWVPNIPDPSVPVGSTEDDNVVRWTWGKPRAFGFEPLSHADLGEQLDIFDTKDAVRMSGTRFYALTGLAARMERALAQMMIDMHRDEHGFEERWVPYAVKREAMIVSAQLPKFAEEAYYLESEDMYLIPTGEVPLVNMGTDRIFEPGELPVLYTGVTPCFRREAGAAGRDTRGMLRMHQFDKVEMVVFCIPQESAAWLDRLVKNAEAVLQRLDLPYHALEMNTSDLGFGQVKKYDLEVWMPSLNRYVEISSCSNMGDFQARRGKMRYRATAGDSPRLLHTLNGSGVAIGRCMAAIWENYQRSDGGIDIPNALVPYMGSVREIAATTRAT